MARGFLSGVVWGGLVGLGAAGVASVLAPPPEAPDVAFTAPVDVTAPDRVETASSGAGGSAQDNAPIADDSAGGVTAPQPDAAPTLAQSGSAVPAAPQTPDAPSAPAQAIAEPQLDAVVDDGVVPAPQALAPIAPGPAGEVAIDTAPAPAPRPIPDQVAAQVDDDPAAPLQEDPITGDAPEEDAQDLQTDTAQTRETIVTAQVDADTQTPDDDTTPQSSALPRITPPAEVVPDEPVIDTAEVETDAADGVDETAPQEADAQTGPTIRAQPDTEVGTLLARDTGVTIRRPSSAGLSETVQTPASDAVTADAQEAGTQTDTRPIRAFAANFEPEEEKPLMSIVLIDDGTSAVSGSTGLAALRDFPYALSFAVDANLPDAAARMSTYREAGFDVLAMINLPEGAQPADAETTFGVVLPEMAEVVGVLEGTEGGFQGGREVGDQITSILLQSGHGLLTQNEGLNTLPKLARKEGVPADPVFRDFDSNDQTATVIRRFLDQAAFRAGIEGSVVMLGRMRPDTISALLLWGLQDRASKVSLAPISAVLLREEE